MTTIESQRGPVPFGRSLNCRDVGGYVTADGLRVRRGLLYRSDLPVLDDEHRAELDALGLATVIDLREPEERDLRRELGWSMPRTCRARTYGTDGPRRTYATRMVVYRPKDPRRFSGTAYLESPSPRSRSACAGPA